MGNLGAPKPLANLNVTKREWTSQEKCLHPQSDPESAKISSAILWFIYGRCVGGGKRGEGHVKRHHAPGAHDRAQPQARDLDFFNTRSETVQQVFGGLLRYSIFIYRRFLQQKAKNGRKVMITENAS